MGENHVEKKIYLVSSDGEMFDVEEVVAAESRTLKKLMEDGRADGIIPIPTITSRILEKVIEYCRKRVETAAKGKDVEIEDLADDEDMKKLLAADEVHLEAMHDLVKEKSPDHWKDFRNFEAEFVREDCQTLLDLFNAANSLDVEELTDLMLEAVVDMFRGRK